MRVAGDVVEENGIVSGDSQNDKHSDEDSQSQSNQTYTNGTHFTDIWDIKSIGSGTWRRMKQKHHKKSRSLKGLKKLDIFSSSPSLITTNDSLKEFSSRKTSMPSKFSSDVLQFTNYETHGSLITLNITDYLERKIIHNESSHATSHDSQMNYSIEEEDNLKETRPSSEKSNKHNPDRLINQEFNQDERANEIQEMSKAINIDPTVLDCYDEATDSDSGIYSLYDSVILTKHQRELGSLQLDSFNSLSTDLDKKFLTDAFHESKSLRVLLEGFHINSYLKFEEEIVIRLKERQDLLRKYETKIELEKVETNESINTLKHKIFEQNTNQLFLLKFQTIMDQIDQITNLIFGIEMKIERCSYNEFNIIDVEHWRGKLADAVAIKNRHNECLNKLIQDNLSSDHQTQLQDKICAKQKQICQLKLIKAEIFCSEMQLKLIFM